MTTTTSTTTPNPGTTTQVRLTRRPAGERGYTEFGWLKSWHSFSFGDYYDPAHMGFRSLRVINDDIVQPDNGFGKHPHRDAEIFTYIIDGALKHGDSMGNERVIRAGDLQYMSAGRGVFHSEINPSKDQPVHLLQIWLRPKMGGGEPRYAEKALGTDARPNALTLLFAGEPRDGAVGIRADADIYFGRLDAGKRLVHQAAPGRGQWIQVFAGSVQVHGETVSEGDGLAIEQATSIEISSAKGAQFLFFDLN